MKDMRHGASERDRVVSRRGQGIAMLTVMVLAAMLMATAAPAGAAALSDLEYCWAGEAIMALVDEGVVGGYPDGTFKPENPVTRAEFAKMVARAFAVRPTGASRFSDTGDNWAKAYITALAEAGIATGYPDGTFGPDKHITRGEMVAMLVRVVKLADKMDSLERPEPTFSDVGPDHWAFSSVEVASGLGILPLHFGVVFEPELATTRAETAWMVKSLIDLKVTDGKLARADTQEGTLTIATAGGAEHTVAVGPDTRVYRNSVAADVGRLMRGDELHVVADSNGELKYVKARGLVTKDDVTTKVSILSKGALDPSDVEALARGDWNAARDDLKPKLAERLVERGLTKDEASNILDANWNELGALAKSRLADAVSDEFGVSSDLIAALLSQDWKLAKTYGEIEVAQYLLARLLNL